MTAPKAAKPKAEAGTKPEFLVIERKLYCQTTEGEIILPLGFKTRIFRELTTGDQAPIDQFFTLLDSLGDKATVAKVEELDIIDTMRIVAKFFEEFAALQEVTSLGESSGQSAS